MQTNTIHLGKKSKTRTLMTRLKDVVISLNYQPFRGLTVEWIPYTLPSSATKVTEVIKSSEPLAWNTTMLNNLEQKSRTELPYEILLRNG